VDARREIRAKTSSNASAGSLEGGETDDESKTLTVHSFFPESKDPQSQIFSKSKICRLTPREKKESGRIDRL